MKLYHLAILAVPVLLGACSSIDKQCATDQDICATVFRNSGMTGDMFYTSVVTKDEKIIAVVGDSQASPAVAILSAGIISTGIIKGGAAVANGIVAGIPEVPAQLPPLPLP